jgi:predicted RNA-binding Zn-ribbon protein involved in translation (DUF1610 family)
LKKVHGFLAMKPVDARDLQEFVCPACNHKTEGEIWRSHGGVKCPQCGIGFILKEIKQREKSTRSTQLWAMFLIAGILMIAFGFVSFWAGVAIAIIVLLALILQQLIQNKAN